MNIIFSLIATASLILSGVFGFQSYQNKVELREENLKLARQQTEFGQKVLDLIDAYVKLGADTTLPVAGMTYTLSGSGVSSSATSITLSSLTIPQSGQKLIDSDFSTTFYLTLEPGNRTRQEIVSCTTVVQNASTATLSGCSRGLSPITPYTASTTLQFAHGGGTSVIFSDPPQLFNLYAALGNDETITGVWTYTSTAAPKYNTTYTASGNEFVSFNQLNGVVVGDVGTSTEAALGLVRLNDASNMGLSTASSTSGAPLVIENKFATTTPGNLCNGGSWNCLVAASSGKIAQTWLNLTEAFTWTGAHTFNSATTTFNATTTISAATSTAPLRLNGISYGFPATQGASSTALMTDGNGNLIWETTDWIQLGETILSSAAASTTVSNFAARTDLKIVISIESLSASSGLSLIFNNARGTSNYGYKIFENYISAGAGSNGNNGIALIGNSTSSPLYFVVDIKNRSSVRKLLTWRGAGNSTTGIEPVIYSGAGVWNNTSAQITTVYIDNTDGNPAFTFGAGTRMTVYGKRN